MHISVVHHRYSSRVPSGENTSVAEHERLMRAAGYDVTTISSSNDDYLGEPVRALRAAAGAALATRRAVDTWLRLVLRNSPDLVHVENVVPVIPEPLIDALRARGIPVLRRWRSYRFSCAAGTFYRDGGACHDCVGVRPVPAVRHACYADSRVASALVAFRRRPHADGVLHVPTSEFVAASMVASGFPAETIHVVPNTVLRPPNGPEQARGVGVVFLGRLEEAKGVGLLLDAWRGAALPSGSTLTVLGDGPLRPLVEDAADVGVVSGGTVDRAGVERAIREAALVVVPSLWDEPFGRAVLEAYALGRPVIATRRGALSELVTDQSGWAVESTAAALRAALEHALGDASERETRTRGAVMSYEANYSPDRYVERFGHVYRRLVDSS